MAPTQSESIEVHQHTDIGDFNQQLLELEAAITRIDLQNDEIEQALKAQLTSLGALDVKCDAKIALLQQLRSQDIQPQVDRLQTAVLQKLDTYERLHEQVRAFHQRSVPLDDIMVILMSRVGAVMNQQGTANVPSQMSPMPDWSMRGSSNLGK